MSVNPRIGSWVSYWDSSDQHRTGTSGDQETNSWLLREIASLGASGTLREFPFTLKRFPSAHLKTAQTTYRGIPMFDGGTTLCGEISGFLTTTPQNDAILVLADSVSNDALESARHHPHLRGIVIVSRLPLPGLALLNAERFESPFGVPVLQVPAEFRNELLHSARAGQNAALSVDVDTLRTKAANVETTIPGANADLDPLVVMTPKSSWYTSTGERIGGIICWLECIRHLMEHPPQRQVIFTANTGHELGHIGLTRFLEANSQLTRQASLWVHFGANFGATDSNLRLQSSSTSNLRLMRSVLKNQDIAADQEVQPGIRPDGEARNIFDGGGDYVSILGSNRLFHHPDDRFDNNVNFARLLRISSAMVECVHRWATSV